MNNSSRVKVSGYGIDGLFEEHKNPLHPELVVPNIVAHTKEVTFPENVYPSSNHEEKVTLLVKSIHIENVNPKVIESINPTAFIKKERSLLLLSCLRYYDNRLASYFGRTYSEKHEECQLRLRKSMILRSETCIPSDFSDIHGPCCA
ncbi:hypothetical protein Tco_0459678 [Tanacetum coccineum]